MLTTITQLCHAGWISPRVTIGALPDSVLLDIFDFYQEAESRDFYGGREPWPSQSPWIRLVHICQRWRYLAFASPLHLDLCLQCTSEASVRKTLDFWPPLPIEIFLDDPHDMDDIIVLLEHHDCVRKIWILNLTNSQMELLVPTMQELPFPALTFLQLETSESVRVLPDMFLVGSAPCLQTLDLSGIPFPGLPRLLLSATDISNLTLQWIPHTGYISPEIMVTGLSALTRLTYLTIGFESPASRPDRRGRRPPPLTRVILPALELLEFQGVSEYLEDLVARIDAPRLDYLHISFFNQLIFDIQQLPHFISHVGILRSSSRAEIIVTNDHIEINLYPPKGTDPPKELNLGIYCRAVDWQVRSMAQICNQFLFLLSIVEQLNIQVSPFEWVSTWQVDMEDTQWLELFRSFTAVQTLRISDKLLPLIVPALQELTGERTMEVLPALVSLCLQKYQPSESGQQAIEPFFAARQYSDHPVAVYPWEGPREGPRLI